jgi:hypothetical protein
LLFPVVHEALRYDVTEHGFFYDMHMVATGYPLHALISFALLLGGHFMAFIRAEQMWLGRVISDVNRMAANKSS